MKKIYLIFLLILPFPLDMYAQVSRLVHYQGELNNEDGTPFDGVTDLNFSIFSSLTSDKPMWSEMHKNIRVTDGSYDVLLGSQNPLDLSFHEYFLEVKSEEINLTSKTKIVGSGYNFRLSFLFAAYTVVWLVLFAYLMSISKRQKKLITELTNVSEVRI